MLRVIDFAEHPGGRFFERPNLAFGWTVSLTRGRSIYFRLLAETALSIGEIAFWFGYDEGSAPPSLPLPMDAAARTPASKAAGGFLV